MNFGGINNAMDDISLADSMNSFVVDDTSNVTEENMNVDFEAVNTILTLGKRNRRAPKRYGDIVSDIEMNSDVEDNINEDSDFKYDSDSDVDYSDSESEMKISENELDDIKSDFKTIVKTSKLYKDNEIERWRTRFEILMSYYDSLCEDDQSFLNNNFILPTKITLPFVYELQENKRFMSIIEYVYKLHEVDSEDEL